MFRETGVALRDPATLYSVGKDLDASLLCLAKERPLVWRGNQTAMVDEVRYTLQAGEKPKIRTIRIRTLGRFPLTAGFDSTATTIAAVVREVAELKFSERATRLTHWNKKASTKKKKIEGHF